MFTVTKEALYKFKYKGVTHYVIEDEPDNDYIKTRYVHGIKDFQKDDFQELIENGEAEISSE